MLNLDFKMPSSLQCPPMQLQVHNVWMHSTKSIGLGKVGGSEIAQALRTAPINGSWMERGDP